MLSDKFESNLSWPFKSTVSISFLSIIYHKPIVVHEWIIQWYYGKCLIVAFGVFPFSRFRSMKSSSIRRSPMWVLWEVRINQLSSDTCRTVDVNKQLLFQTNQWNFNTARQMPKPMKHWQLCNIQLSVSPGCVHGKRYCAICGGKWTLIQKEAT